MSRDLDHQIKKQEADIKNYLLGDQQKLFGKELLKM